MSKRAHCTTLVLIACSFVLSWLLFMPGILYSWDLRGNDLLFKLRYRLFGTGRVSPCIAHLNIDNVSIKALGTSEESAGRYKKIIDVLSAASASAVVFDMVILKSEEGKEHFASLVESVAKAGCVYFPVVLQDADYAVADAGKPAGTFPGNQLWKMKIKEAERLGPNCISFITAPELADKAKGIGYINCPPDEDGIFRRYPLIMRYGSGFVPSMAFRAVCDYLSVKDTDIDIVFGRHVILHDAVFPDGRKKDLRIPIDDKGRMILNFCGPWEAPKEKSFAMYRLKQLYEVDKDPAMMEQLINAIEERIVIVADISEGKDTGPVPVDRSYRLPGLHSTVINSILTESFVKATPAAGMMLIDVFLIALMYMTALRFRARWYTTVTVLIFAAFLLSAAALFFYRGILMDSVRSGTGIIIAFVSVGIYKYLCEEEEKTMLRAKFESYFSPSILNKIIKTPHMLDVRQKKVITILFSDIAGFTSWSSLKQPEEIHSTLNEYFQEMATIVFKYDGTIDKYIGDGLMAFFGDPVEHPDHALRAVQAAVEMQKKTRELKKKWEQEGRMAIKIRIGIDTGEAVVGNMGSEKRVNYTAIGAHVNMAQRLESNAPVEGILISGSVYDSVKDKVSVKPVGKIRAKGFENEIEVYEVAVV